MQGSRSEPYPDHLDAWSSATTKCRAASRAVAMRPAQLLSSVFLLTSLSSALSWQDSWSGLKALEIGGMLRRQDDTNSSTAGLRASKEGAEEHQLTSIPASSAASTSQSSASDTAAASSDQATDSSVASSTAASSGGSSTATASSSSSSKITSSAQSTDQATSTTTSTNSTTSFNAALPAGGITMVTPNPLSSAQYYKIGNNVTFAWNYTSLSITPSAVDILASCTANQETYTLALNQSVPTSGAIEAFTWDTGAYQSSATVPLLTETYTLIIYDAAKQISATAQAGYLDTYDSFTFAMYKPQLYVPLADWVCATCSGATGSLERHTWGFLAGMAGITVLSFTWFAGDVFF